MNKNIVRIFWSNPAENFASPRHPLHMSTPDVAASRKLVTWSDKYSVGLTRIDAEHQRLVDLINELYAAVIGGKGDAVVGKVLAGLTSYTLSHFSTEESLMKTHRYPDYDRHKAEHDKLVAQVQQLQSDFRKGKATVSQDVLTFLQRWLIGHILAVDKKYVSHLQAAGVK